MRIGLDYRPAAGYSNSGIGRQNLALEDALRANPQVSLQLFGVAPEDHPLRRRVHCPRWGAPLQGVHRLPNRLRFEGGFLPEALREAEVELYICNFNMGLPLGRKPKNLRYVLQLHDLFQLTLTNSHGSRLKERVYGLTDKLSIGHSVKQADRIWTPSQYTADELVKLFPQARDKVRVLPNLVTGFQGEPADIRDLQLPERYWLAVGTREPRKNIPWFVAAWQAARQQSPDVPELVLIGAPEHLPSELRAVHGLHFLSDLSDSQLHGVYRQAQRLWQPSYAEGFGLPVIEALSVGTPVAVASGSALDEITPAGSPRFSPTDSAALSQLMVQLASAPPEDPTPLKAWAAGYAEDAYRQRFNELLEELK
ncbi:glycosyltransferase involved in cell wall biosynthesis [Pseudomonas protegens]|jgi:glycosyltransferase involved in cell wall biosynthesis|uniref:glycosyltransferase family 4 protein n=1 Tax=Pseudomonas TaxID=286 RepID=UPI00098D493E|nr:MULTISPECIES: glycosyltransferase family 1 protein [Pseudomonas]GED74552.1 glycosyl transferase family 1 [Pseudomonas fluorescens]AQT11153.1 glycosyltransferase PslI [Pseudomonas protegens]MBB1611035.1 glycosyl transferase family 1 [Pseudomonas sp. UMC65]MBB1621170.1 glycosyl transferase family 1 [Pseudomonas sp. UME65]MDF4209066.1 glycosyltransferase family 1 protein [Pseudomonas protegens]